MIHPQIKVRKYWIARSKLMLAGLLAIILIILQDLISSGVFNSNSPKTFDVPLLISAIAFAIALPLLSVQLLATFEDELNYYDPQHSRPNNHLLDSCHFPHITGIVATFWHILPLVGILFLAVTIIGGGVYIHYRDALHHHDDTVKAEQMQRNKKIFVRT